MRALICVLPGDGIGPEVTKEAVAVLDAGTAGPKVDGRGVQLSRQQLLELGSVNQGNPGPPPLRHQVPREAHQPRAVGPPEALPGNVHR